MKIEQNFDPDFEKKFIRHQNIGKRLSKSMVRGFIERLAGIARSIDNDIKRRERLEKHLEIQKSTDSSEYGYTRPFGDLHAALNYATEIHEPGFSENSLGESYLLYQKQIESLREALSHGKIKRVFNFGICYAHVDAILAQEFPEIQFSGIDLSPHNKAFNDCEFGHIPNLEIITGDVFSNWQSDDFNGALLFHSRTLVLLPKIFIKKLYSAAKTAGFEWIMGFEQNGLSEETLSPFTFDLTDRPSVYWRDGMYLHNYLAIAEEAGFKVKTAENFKTNHTSPDYRVLTFLARAAL